MQEFGSPKPSKELYKKVRINGEVYDLYAKLPAKVLKTSRDFSKFLDSMRDPQTGEIDEDKFNEGEYNAALFDLLPNILPEATSEALISRMNGDTAPILEVPVMLEVARWILAGMPAEATEQVAASSGKAKGGQKPPSTSSSKKKSTSKSQAN